MYALTYACVDIAFSKWDVSTEIQYWFQRFNIRWGYGTILIKTHKLCFIWVHAETGASYCLLQECSGDSAWAVIFARSDGSSTSSASVVVSVGYRLLLAFLVCKRFISFDQSTFVVHLLTFVVHYQSKIVNRNSANTSPCKTSATTSKKLVITWWTTLCFRVFLEHHGSGLFKKTIR